MAGEQNTGGTTPESGGYDGFAPMPLGQRSSEELGLGPSAPPVWPNGRPEYGGLPPYGTPYVPPMYTPPAGAGAPTTGSAPGVSPYAAPPYEAPPYGAPPIGSAADEPAAYVPAPYAAAPQTYAAAPQTYAPAPPGATPPITQPAYAAPPRYAPPPGFAAAPRAGALPGWGWGIVVLIALVIIVVVIGAATRILTAAPTDGPATPEAGATDAPVPTPGAPAPAGTVTLDVSANLPAGTVLAMAATADWAPYDTVDPEHLLGPAAPAGEDAWRSPCYFALHSNEGAYGDDDRDGSEYWGELAQKYASPGTTATPIASLLVPGPDGVLYEFSGYSEISTGDYEKASVNFTRVDVAGDRTYEIAVRCDGTEVPQDALDAVASQFHLE